MDWQNAQLLMFKTKNKGQTLIEFVVALSFIAMIATAITTATVTTLNNAEFSNNQSLATKYSQEGMEIVRTIRDNNYTAFGKLNGVYCLPQGQITLSSGSCTSPNVANIFIRKITISTGALASQCGANSSLVTVSDSWTDGKCAANSYCHASTLISCLGTVNPINAP